MYNRIMLIGRLTRDPELSYTANGVALTKFTLAVDRAYKSADGNKETDFINIVAWRKLGETCANYLAKGKLAFVEGRLQIRNYDDKDGNKRTATDVVADDVRFLSPRDGNAPAGGSFGAQTGSAGGSGFGGGFGGGMSAPKSAPAFSASNDLDEMPLTDDDLPF